MFRTRLLRSGLGAALAAGGLLVALPTVASAQPPDGHEHFSIVFTGDGNLGSIVASGRFGAVGTIVDLTPDSTGTDVSKAVFHGVGTFLVHVTQTASTDRFNQHTCVDRFTFTDDLTFSDGTGQFRGIDGTGSAHGRGTFVAKRNQTGCNVGKASGQVIIQADANLSFSAPGTE